MHQNTTPQSVADNVAAATPVAEQSATSPASTRRIAKLTSAIRKRLQGLRRAPAPSSESHVGDWGSDLGRLVAWRACATAAAAVRTNRVEFYPLMLGPGRQTPVWATCGAAADRMLGSIWLAPEHLTVAGSQHLAGYSLRMAFDRNSGVAEPLASGPTAMQLAFFEPHRLAEAREMMMGVAADIMFALGIPAAPREPTTSRVHAFGLTQSAAPGGRQWTSWLAPALAGVAVVLLINLWAARGVAVEPASARASSVEPTVMDQPPAGFGQLTADQQREMMDHAFAAARDAVGSPAVADAAASATASNSRRLDAAQVRSIQDVKGQIDAPGLESALRNKVKRVWAFEDPQCPSCQRLARAAHELDATQYRVTVLPVAFFEGSRDLAARALCAKDPHGAWKTLMLGVAPTNDVCEEGLSKIDENTRLFTQLGLDATPSLVAPNGQLVVGDGSANAIRNWIGAQYAELSRKP